MHEPPTHFHGDWHFEPTSHGHARVPNGQPDAVVVTTGVDVGGGTVVGTVVSPTLVVVVVVGLVVVVVVTPLLDVVTVTTALVVVVTAAVDLVVVATPHVPPVHGQRRNAVAVSVATGFEAHVVAADVRPSAEHAVELR